MTRHNRGYRQARKARTFNPLAAFRRWRCWRHYNRLNPAFRNMVDFVGDDPQSLIDRGKL